MHIHIIWNAGLQRFIMTSPTTTVGQNDEEIIFHLAGADSATVTFPDNLKIRDQFGGSFITSLTVLKGAPTTAMIQGGDNVWDPPTSHGFVYEVTVGGRVAEAMSGGARPGDPIIIIHPPLT